MTDQSCKNNLQNLQILEFCKKSVTFAKQHPVGCFDIKFEDNWFGTKHRWSGSFATMQLIMVPGPWFNIKMTSYQYRKSHCGDKTVLRWSYLHKGISYTGKMSSLYWTGPQVCSHPIESIVENALVQHKKMGFFPFCYGQNTIVENNNFLYCEEIHHHTSNIGHILLDNKSVDHKDVVGASLVHAAPTT